MPVAAEIPDATFADDYRRLTDPAAGKNFPLQGNTAAVTLPFVAAHRGRGRMPRTDRSVTFLTGMIIAALYVILLLGFSRETYVLRGLGPDALRPARSAPMQLAMSSPQGCGIERPLCTAQAEQARSCANAVSVLRQMVGEALPPPVLDELHGAAASAGDLE
jgi:hypothetical protein